MKQINIPVEVSDFAEIRKNGYYYIDKSGLICELMKTTATKVTLITRPQMDWADPMLRLKTEETGELSSLRQRLQIQKKDWKKNVRMH